MDKYKRPLNEITRWDILRQSQKQSPKRYDKKRFYKAKDFNNVDFEKLFTQDSFVWRSRVGDYIVTISFEGAFQNLYYEVSNWSGKNRWKRIDLKLLTKCLSKALDTEDLQVDCTCPDFCLHEDTKIKTITDESYTIKELYDKFNNGENICVYSVTNDGSLKIGNVSDIWISGYVEKLIKVTLSNDEEILTTDNHLYMLTDGSYIRADELKINQPLMSMYAKYVDDENAIKVKKIDVVKYDSKIPVYDLTVSKYNNFALDSEIILHNCYRFAYWLSRPDIDAKYGLKQNIAPKVRNVKNNQGRACKHILSVLHGKRWVPAAAKAWLNFIKANPKMAEELIWG
jgi:hypothetical protein